MANIQKIFKGKYKGDSEQDESSLPALFAFTGNENGSGESNGNYGDGPKNWWTDWQPNCQVTYCHRPPPCEPGDGNNPDAKLEISKSASVPGGTANVAGEIISYEILVTNTGIVNLTNVVVTDPLASNLTGPSFAVGDNDAILEPGEVWKYTADHTVSQAELNSFGDGDGLIENTAFADSDQTGQVSDNGDVLVEPGKIDINKTAGVLTVDEVGDIIPYSVTVTNTGNLTLTNVQVNDPLVTLLRSLPDILGDEDNDLEPGEIWHYTGTYFVTQNDIDTLGGGNHLIENTATVTTDQNATDSDDAHVIIDPKPDATGAELVADEDDLLSPPADSAGNNDVQPGDDAQAGLTGDLGDYGPDGPGALTFDPANGDPVLDTLASPVTSGGDPVLYFWDAATDTLYGTTDATNAGTAAANAVFKIVVDQTDCTYEFTLLNHVDHASGDNENDVLIDVPYTITDSNGSTDSNVVSVKIDDDLPIGDTENCLEPGTDIGQANPDDLLFVIPPGAGLKIDITDAIKDAGYDNSLGYYFADSSGEPISGAIIMDSAAGLGSDADTDKFLEIPAGDVPGTAVMLGFFVIPNGNLQNPGLEDGDPVTFADNGNGWDVFKEGEVTPLNSGEPGDADDGIFFSDRNLNPNGDDKEQDDTIPAAVEPRDSNWEDLLNPDPENDEPDFNDVRFNVEVCAIAKIAVVEDALLTGGGLGDAGDLSDGNLDPGQDNNDDEGTFTHAALASQIDVGADVPPKIALTVFADDLTPVLDTGGIPVTSKGAGVFFHSVSDTEIIGFADDNGTPGEFDGADRVIFRLTQTVGDPDDPTDDTWTFDLEDQIDHPPASGDGAILSLDLTAAFSATDSDDDPAVFPAKAITVDVQNDVPAPVEEEATVSAKVLEDGLSLADDVGDEDESEGNREGVETTDDDEASDASLGSGSLADLFSVGADEEMVISLSSDTTGLPALFSKGDAVSYAVTDEDGDPDGLLDTLTATAGGRTIFTLTVNPGGSWTFDLDDQLDHVDNGLNDENLLLRTAVDGSTSVAAIDFSSIIVATDEDEDPAPALPEGSFTIEVEDDVPVPSNEEEAIVSAAVKEDGLSTLAEPTDLSEGNRDVGETTSDDEASSADFGSLAGLYVVGADEELTIGLSNETSGLPDLFSKGDPVSYAVTDTIGVDGVLDTLTATAGGRTIFTLTVSPGGLWTFDLDDQLDHEDNSGDTSTTLVDGLGTIEAIDFSSIIVATDADGDEAPALADGSFTVEVENDVPIVDVSDEGEGSVEDLALNLDETTDPDGNNTPGGGEDTYNADNSETESNPGVPNGDDDDTGTLAPDGVNPIGSLTTAAGALASLFSVTTSPGADEPVTATFAFAFNLTVDGAATTLSATQPALGGNPGAPYGDPTIYLFQIDDHHIEGHVGSATDGGGNPTGPLALTITLNNPSDPATASITFEQFLAIDHGDDGNDFDTEALLTMLTVEGGEQPTLDVTLTASAADFDEDPAEDSASVTLIDNALSPFSIDDDGPVAPVIAPAEGEGEDDPFLALALNLDETIDPDGDATNNGADNYNGLETESNGGPTNGDLDDTGQATVDGINAIGSLTTTAGALSGLFTVDPGDAGTDGEKSLVHAFAFELSTGVLGAMTNLSASQPAPGGNPGAPYGDPTIYLFQIDDHHIEGHVGSATDAGGNPTGPLALTITLDDPTPALDDETITFEQYLLIDHGDVANFDTELLLNLIGDDTLGVNLAVTLTDGDNDTVVGEQSITLIDNELSPFSIDDDQSGPLDLFIVGSNADDKDPLEDVVSLVDNTHVVPKPGGPDTGSINGEDGNDILIGDPGGTEFQPGETANIILVMDSSGSMTTDIEPGPGVTTRMEALQDSVNILIDALAASGADAIRIHLIDFGTNAVALGAGTFDLILPGGIVNGPAIAAAHAAVGLMSAGGFTNYEAGLQRAIEYIASGDIDPTTTAVDQLMFISDGVPNRSLSGNAIAPVVTTNTPNSLAHLNGTFGGVPLDNVSEIGSIIGSGYTLSAVGIDVGETALDVLDQVEGASPGDPGDHEADNVTSPAALTDVLLDIAGAGDNPLPAGNDVINGGAGNDLIFGDVPFTDDLRAATGLSPVIFPNGSGWAVFDELEGTNPPIANDPAGNGAPWDRDDTIQYIKDNLEEIAQESGRTGGNDTINAGDGDDIVFGQEGDDIIDGGEDNDTLAGGTGDDSVTGSAGDDLFVLQGSGGGLDTIADLVSGTDMIVVDIASQGVTIGTATAIAGGQFDTGMDETAPASWDGADTDKFFFEIDTSSLWYSAIGDGTDRVKLAEITSGVPAAADIYTY